MATRLLRLPAVRDLTGLRTTSIYDQAKNGLFPPPVKLTERCSAWPENEVDAINTARIAGKTDDEIRELVAQLLVQRKQAAGRVIKRAHPTRDSLPSDLQQQEPETER